MGLDNPIHLAFLLILLLLVFGAKRLPEMGRSLGSGMRGFKDALSGEDTDILTTSPNATQAAAEQQPTPVVVHTLSDPARATVGAAQQPSDSLPAA
jgi:sec-independent protein translocase protein TatA